LRKNANHFENREKDHMKRILQALLFASLAATSSISQERAPLPLPIQSVMHSAVDSSGEKIWADLMEGNQRFVSGETRSREVVQLRHSLAQGQHPHVIVLTCSDSRVSPELVFDQSLGDLFVIRAAGNIADAIQVGSIEYAQKHLGSSVLVVLGHEKCGAVTAACSGEKMPTANLQAIVDQIEPAVVHARAYAKADALLDSAIRENIHQSAKDVLAHSEVLKRAHDEGKLLVVEAIYKLDGGEVVRLSNAADTH
jgi:carbonic anhydrase